jgi:hypothetical protein
MSPAALRQRPIGAVGRWANNGQAIRSHPSAISGPSRGIHFSRPLDDSTDTVYGCSTVETCCNHVRTTGPFIFTVAEAFLVTEVSPFAGEAFVGLEREVVVRFSSQFSRPQSPARL